MKQVDYDQLRRVLEHGIVDACHEAGLSRVAVCIHIDTLVAPTADSKAEVVPVIRVEVCELSEAEVAELVKTTAKVN